MREIRNANGILVAKVDEKAGIIEIVRKGCVTQLMFHTNGTIKIINK